MWREYFKLPMQLIGGKCIDSEGRMLFDFMSSWYNFDNKVIISKEAQNRILECFNSDKYLTNPELKFSFDKESCLVLLNGMPFILIRGWGYLTGTGGLNLSSEKAIEVQNSLGEYLAEQLNKR